MLRYELLPNEKLLIVTPEESLAAEDFEQLTLDVDPFIEQHGPLRGLMIYTESFPGWENLAGFIAHMKFVSNHHQRIKKIAAVTDSDFLAIAPRVAKHFVKAEVRQFPFADKQAALAWLQAS